MKIQDCYYILKNKRVVKAKNVLEWGRWFEESIKTKGRTVAVDEIKKGTLSTVFVGIGYTRWLFETCWFPKKGESEVLDKYLTWSAAKKGHKKHLTALMTFVGTRDFKGHNATR